MTVSTRPRKRQRSTAHDGEKLTNVGPVWDDGLVALIERLESIRVQAVTLRDQYQNSVTEIDGRIAVRDRAKRAVARISAPSPQNGSDANSLDASSPSESYREGKHVERPTAPIDLLLEAEPPEKVIHEQSVIVRAQAINRRNAELARERLPKQPEAQRNKTHHDYFLDEAVWMAADFREERKLKIQLARKVSKMVVQFHAQRHRRAARAQLEAHYQHVKLAGNVAKDVRKFWNQIGEIAEYKNSLLEEAQQAEERRVQLRQLVEQTDQYTEKLAKSLHVPSNRVHICRDERFSAHSDEHTGKPVKSQTVLLSSENSSKSKSPSHVIPPLSICEKGVEAKDEEDDHNIYDIAGAADDGCRFERKDIDEPDDESTLAAAEAEEANDPQEVHTLAHQAKMDMDDLLRSQGIDPSAYRSDTRKYLSDSADSSSSSNRDADADMEEDQTDNESTIQAAEAEDGRDGEEGRRLQGENAVSVEDVLKMQGIDPNTYFADRRNYLDPEETSQVQAEAKDMSVDCPSPGMNAVDVETKPNAKKLADVLRPDPHTPTADPLSSVDRDQQSLETGRISPLLRGKLRSYQKAGMDWLVSLYRQNVNGILADEMGLGKTIQTIALLAWLAAEKGIWGPHLVVVPTSVMVNWEVEFKKWLPGFKIMTYFGSMKERKMKRQGWTKPNLFHVCITSYRLAVQDATILRRKKWIYLILDEAHNIKNFESQRWQTLLSFSSERRLLITGTPLQNSVMELWSLMHFLMPEIFSSHSEFKGWFSKPLIEAAEAENERSADRAKVVSNLHRALRPFLLRRLKVDVEKGLPPKFEHVVYCHLSKRQRQLYEDFISRNDVRETLQSHNMEGIVSVLIQLKKVCNHPDLFEGRPILSPFSMRPLFYPVPSSVPRLLSNSAAGSLTLRLLNLDLASIEENWAGAWYNIEAERISAGRQMKEFITSLQLEEDRIVDNGDAHDPYSVAQRRSLSFRKAMLSSIVLVNALRIRQKALLGEDLRSVVTMSPTSLAGSLRINTTTHSKFLPARAANLCRSIESVAEQAREASERFVCCITKASAPTVEMRYPGDDAVHRKGHQMALSLGRSASHYRSLFRSFEVRSQVTIPDTRLVQWDCGKLQVLAKLLRKLRAKGSRVLVFTQMSKVLDVLETFLNLHTYKYLRLDGTTKADDRQKIVERFNTDTRIFCMILTTRAGGVGLNLTGASSVVFYDTDYNPAIDNQAQDRAHRIGQTKPVNIYRLVSERTVEENILQRANQKRSLEAVVISSAGFTTDAIVGKDSTSAKPGGKESVREGSLDTRRSGLVDPAAVRNGLGLNGATGGLNAPRKENGPPDQGNVGLSMARSPSPVKADAGASGVDCIVGASKGFTAKKVNPTEGQSEDRRASEEKTEADISEYEKLTAKLLAKEDKREGIALTMAEQEKKDLHAEFEDTASKIDGDVDVNSDARRGVISSYRSIKASLTPIQLYALRIVEKAQEADSKWFAPTLSDGKLQPHTPTDNEVSENLEENSEFTAEDDPKGEGSQSTLFYDIDTSDNGRINYLKALTDADADIKLYLPLRDGDPEELKVSAVVSGTAAAGLECAEDAAFFPHAYNRMSRTPYATRRQREKGLANLRKRRAEKEARRQRDNHVAAAQAAANAAAVAEKQTSSREVEHHKLQPSISPGVLERVRGAGTKSKGEQLRSGSSLFGRRSRVEQAVKGKPAATVGTVSQTDSLGTSNMGLFKRTSRKNSRRLTLLAGKSASGSSTGGMPGDGLGVNDGWTTEEDQTLISTASEFNNNMVLVADLLSSDLRVAAGLRRHRSHTHCIDRLINCLGKDKSGPPSAKAASSDADIFRRHQEALREVIGRSQETPSAWMVIPPASVDLHISHKKAVAQAATKMKGPFRKDGIPPFKTIFAAYETPKHFRPGLKTIETTPQALSKQRYPFLRPPREDARTLHQKGTGQPSRYNGAPSGQGPLHRGDPNLFSKISQKAFRGQQQHPSTGRGAAHGRNNTPARSNPPARTKSDIVGSRAVGITNSSPSNANTATPMPFTSSRKGHFVPGTSGRINVGQYGNTDQGVPSSHGFASVEQTLGAMKPPSGNSAGMVGAPVSSLKPGVRKAVPTKLVAPSAVKSGDQLAVGRRVPQSQQKIAGMPVLSRGNAGRGLRTNGVSPANPSPSGGGKFIGGKGGQPRALVSSVSEQHPHRSPSMGKPTTGKAKGTENRRIPSLPAHSQLVREKGPNVLQKGVAGVNKLPASGVAPVAHSVPMRLPTHSDRTRPSHVAAEVVNQTLPLIRRDNEGANNAEKVVTSLTRKDNRPAESTGEHISPPSDVVNPPKTPGRADAPMPKLAEKDVDHGASTPSSVAKLNSDIPKS